MSGSQLGTWSYAWIHLDAGCFLEEDRVVATVEAFSGFAKIAGRLMGPFSGMVVRTQDEEYRFDRLVDRWNHRVEQEPGIYNLRLKKGRLRASLSVSAKTENALCLGTTTLTAPGTSVGTANSHRAL